MASNCFPLSSSRMPKFSSTSSRLMKYKISMQDGQKSLALLLFFTFYEPSVLMPLPLTVTCFSKIQIGFTFLVPAHLGSPGKGQLNGCVLCVCYKSVKRNDWIHSTSVASNTCAGKVLKVVHLRNCWSTAHGRTGQIQSRWVTHFKT